MLSSRDLVRYLVLSNGIMIFAQIALEFNGISIFAPLDIILSVKHFKNINFVNYFFFISCRFMSVYYALSSIVQG